MKQQLVTSEVIVTNQQLRELFNCWLMVLVVVVVVVVVALVVISKAFATNTCGIVSAVSDEAHVSKQTGIVHLKRVGRSRVRWTLLMVAHLLLLSALLVFMLFVLLFSRSTLQTASQLSQVARLRTVGARMRFRSGCAAQFAPILGQLRTNHLALRCSKLVVLVDRFGFLVSLTKSAAAVACSASLLLLVLLQLASARCAARVPAIVDWHGVDSKWTLRKIALNMDGLDGCWLWIGRLNEEVDVYIVMDLIG